jgi:predicted secreted protein
MKETLRAIFPLIVLALAVVSISAQSKPSPTPASPPLKLERTGKFDGNVIFPDVEGWTRGERSQYPTPELGYSVTYSSPKGRVTVYVYNAGLKKIPNDLTGPVAEQMKNAREDVKAIVEQGAYQSATEGKVQTLAVGGPSGKVKSLHTEFTLKSNGNEFDSETYIFPYNDYFIKIRVTRPKAVGKTEKLQELMKEIDQLFSI